MKRRKLYLVGLITVGLAGIFSSCSKKTTESFDIETSFDNTSQVQVYNAIVNATRNYIYIDGNPVTGTTLGIGSVFPSSAYASALPGGLKSFLIRDTAAVTTQVPLNFAENFQVGKNYTIFLYDSVISPKQKTVITDISIPSDSTARLRVANFLYNPTAIPAVDVFSYIRNANIFTNVAVTDVTNFIPYASGVNIPLTSNTDTLYFREAGTMNQIVKIPIALTKKRSYTVALRGSWRGTRTASLFTNY